MSVAFYRVLTYFNLTMIQERFHLKCLALGLH